MLVKVNLLVSNNQLESRMREIRQSGSVGGKPQPNAASLPQSDWTTKGQAKQSDKNLELQYAILRS